jgi:hypothetical protein
MLNPRENVQRITTNTCTYAAMQQFKNKKVDLN